MRRLVRKSWSLLKHFDSPEQMSSNDRNSQAGCFTSSPKEMPLVMHCKLSLSNNVSGCMPRASSLGIWAAVRVRPSNGTGASFFGRGVRLVGRSRGGLGRRRPLAEEPVDPSAVAGRCDASEEATNASLCSSSEEDNNDDNNRNVKKLDMSPHVGGRRMTAKKMMMARADTNND